jgi:hypothetical protein
MLKGKAGTIMATCKDVQEVAAIPPGFVLA